MAPSTKPRVLLMNGPTEVPQSYVNELKTLVDFYTIQQAPHDILAQRIADAVKKDGPFIAFLSFLRWHETWPWPLDEGLVGPLVDTGCKLISSGGAGYDFLDVDYLTRHGVYYANTAVSAAVRTADSTAALILQVMRAGSEHEMNVREGKFLDRSLRAKDVRRSTLGIIGMGNIGKLVRDHMQHFGMKVTSGKAYVGN